jgi:hypothetical protein
MGVAHSPEVIRSRQSRFTTYPAVDPFMTELTRVRPKLPWMVMLEAMMKQEVMMKRKLDTGLVARLALCLDAAHR